jgi:hypothetical protein
MNAAEAGKKTARRESADKLKNRKKNLNNIVNTVNMQPTRLNLAVMFY